MSEFDPYGTPDRVDEPAPAETVEAGEGAASAEEIPASDGHTDPDAPQGALDL